MTETAVNLNVGASPGAQAALAREIVHHETSNFTLAVVVKAVASPRVAGVGVGEVWPMAVTMHLDCDLIQDWGTCYLSRQLMNGMND